MKKETEEKRKIALRKKAEKRLKERAVKAQSSIGWDSNRLFHELETHQIELEMQNEELRTAQVEVADSQRKFADLYNLAPVGYFTLDHNGLIHEVNFTGAEMLGDNKRLLIGKPLSPFVAQNDLEVLFSHFKKVFETRTIQTCEVILMKKKKKKSIFYAMLHSVHANDPSCPDCCYMAIIDITDRKRTEEELERYKDHLEELVKKRTADLLEANEELDRKVEEIGNINEQLRDLSGHLQTVREDERAHIAREIHDELGQNLTALKMDLYRIEKKLSEGKIREDMKTAIESVDGTIETVRKIISSLRPDVLDHLGLSAAIHWLSRDFCKRTGMRCDLEVDLAEAATDDPVSTGLYRIFQEAMTNVARHAEAKKVNISLKAEGGWIILEVRDNGKGISEADIGGAKSFGLMGMRERAHSMGGEVTFKGVRGRGTTVTVKIPVKEGDNV